MKKRILSVALCLCMVLSLLPVISITASAKAMSGIGLGTRGIVEYDSTIGYNYIYFGQYDTTNDGTINPTPIKWRVLADTNGNGGTYKDSSNANVAGANAMFLLSENLLGDVPFGNKTWSSSNLKQWMDEEVYNGSGIFSLLEKEQILKTTTTEDTDVGSSTSLPGLQACQLSDDILFPLSADEATRSEYGFETWDVSDSDRVAFYASTAQEWWLRSPSYATDTMNVGVSTIFGSVDFFNHGFVRPACNLNKSSILFASAATETAPGGKASGSEGADALAQVSATKPTEWKLTLLDSTRNFGVWITAASADSVSFDYYGAKTGANEYISAVIVDDLGYILYYGRIQKSNNFSGSATINIPTGVTLGNNATLKLFNEQYNGDYKTDYASALQSLDHRVTYSLTNLGQETNVCPLYVADGDDLYPILTANSGYIFPNEISVKVGNSFSQRVLGDDAKLADVAGEYFYDNSTGQIKVAKVNGPVVITAEGVSAISTSPKSLDFGTLAEGYTMAPAEQTVTITNNCSEALTGYTVTGGGSDYNITCTSAPISAGGTGTFKVKPVIGLSTGVHAKTLTIETAEGITTTVGITFTVQAKPSSGGSNTSSVLVTEIKNGGSMSTANLSQLVSRGKALTVDGDKGAKLVFSTEALKGISGQTSGDIKVEMKDVSSTYQEKLPGKQVFSLSVSSGSSTITNFGGAVTVTLPYTPKAGESVDEVTVWYLASDGTMTEIPCTYDPVTKLATFKVTHFSLYAVGVNTPWVNPFSDVRDSDWFYGAVEFVSRNGMMQGIGGTDFSPNTTVTRGMLVTILLRLEKEHATTKTISFVDVSDSKWYAKAVKWAAANGIASGIGGNQFAPEKQLTREQLALMLFNYAKYKGYDVSVGENTNILSYNDAFGIPDYAYLALQWASGMGIINGDGSGNLNLKSPASRAEVSVMLERFIKYNVSN